MAIYKILNAAIYPYYEIIIEHLKNERKSIVDDELNRAINLTIILSCACRIEGILESKTKGIIRYYEEIYRKINIPEFEVRKPINIFFRNICDDLKHRISQSMGIDKYDEICKLLLRKSFKQDEKVIPHLETVQVLFQLRNVIAHGREISASEKITDHETFQGDEYFFGGYKKAESLLLRKGVIKDRFIKQETASMFFVNEVADYFLETTDIFLATLDRFIEENLECLRTDTTISELVREFNEKHQTALTVDNFFENVTIEISDVKLTQ